MYRTNFWLEPGDFEPSGLSIVDYAEIDSATRGELLMSEDDLDVFVSSFEKGGFVAPCNWYRNFTRNWEITEGVSQEIIHPALMIYGEYDMVRPVDMSSHVADLEIQTLECGHWIQQEKADETNSILLDWLDRKMRV